MYHCSSSASRSSGTASHRSIVVLVAAYRSPVFKTFDCVLARMERTTSRVVVVSCLTRVPRDGLRLSVSSVSSRLVREAEHHNLIALQFCLLPIRDRFVKRQVELQPVVRTGDTREDIAITVAREFRPRWILVDSSLLRTHWTLCPIICRGNRKHSLEEELEENPELRRISNLGFIRPGSLDPRYVLGAFFPANENVSTSGEIVEEEEHVDVSFEVTSTKEVISTKEEIVEEHRDQSNTIACCGGVTICAGSSSSSSKAVSRGEDRVSLQTLTSRKGKGILA